MKMNLKSGGFVAGIVVAGAVLWLPTPAGFITTARQMLSQAPAGLNAEQLASSMQSVLAVLLLMIVWWLTEAVPLPATALLPAVLFPVLKVTGVQGKALAEFHLKNTLVTTPTRSFTFFWAGS